ncbi:MAG: hypothetical protein CVU51_10020 [Deltaproteobacteria bacterium HGW-Deltaproteobacteria-1]|jgi:hypothetical protein|nr:MAG: hypothetical protein CVU51_10020 [Deltaproteobacteria bacterium HGW-Deltaproteobacteria-1]
MKNGKSKWILAGICLLVLLTSIIVYIFRDAILFKAGCFMAPVGDYHADVAIIEGSDFVSTGIVMRGVNLLLSGKVKRLVIVLQNIAPKDRPYGINGNYKDLIRQKLENHGLKEMEFNVITVPVRHPITLNEAKVVLQGLSKENIKSAVLLSTGFHTRRSYLAYQHEGLPLQIKIFPYAYFPTYNLSNWRVNSSGVRDFEIEVLKLFYYMISGYIPLKFSYSGTPAE